MFDLSKVWSSGVPLCVADHSFILITCLLHNVLMLHWEVICWLLGKQRIKRKQASTDVLIKLSSHKVVPHKDKLYIRKNCDFKFLCTPGGCLCTRKLSKKMSLTFCDCNILLEITYKYINFNKILICHLSFKNCTGQGNYMKEENVWKECKGPLPNLYACLCALIRRWNVTSGYWSQLEPEN